MRKRERQTGYALMSLLLMAALVLILLGIEAPRILTQGQRDKEDELIFRGEQYRRALALHFRKYGRLPLKLEELYEPNNSLRFLRKPWRDPMTTDGQWRLIRVGPLGELVGSVTRDRMQMQASPGGAAGAAAEREKKEEKAKEEPRGLESGATNLPIIGVASRSGRRGIKVYQNESTYARWEFIFDPVADTVSRATPPGTTQPLSPARSPTPPR